MSNNLSPIIDRRITEEKYIYATIAASRPANTPTATPLTLFVAAAADEEVVELGVALEAEVEVEDVLEVLEAWTEETEPIIELMAELMTERWELNTPMEEVDSEGDGDDDASLLVPINK